MPVPILEAMSLMSSINPLTICCSLEGRWALAELRRASATTRTRVIRWGRGGEVVRGHVEVGVVRWPAFPSLWVCYVFRYVYVILKQWG